MSKFEVRPILIAEKRMSEFYEFLLKSGYNIKIWSKQKNKDIYKFFLPEIREYMFWTFNLGKESKFRSMTEEMQAAVCNNYKSTVFEKDGCFVVSFYTGVSFVIYEKDNSIQDIISYEEEIDLEEININRDKKFKIEVENDAELFNYIISLYKFVMLSKLNKDMEDKDLFDKNRKIFVNFIQEIYSKKITDNLQGNKKSAEWEQKLEVDKLYLAVENKFDILYRNNRLDDKNTMFRIIIILLIVLIIVGTINLGNWIA